MQINQCIIEGFLENVFFWSKFSKTRNYKIATCIMYCFLQFQSSDLIVLVFKVDVAELKSFLASGNFCPLLIFGPKFLQSQVFSKSQFRFSFCIPDSTISSILQSQILVSCLPFRFSNFKYHYSAITNSDFLANQQSQVFSNL